MDPGVPRSHGNSSGNQPSRIVQAGIAVTVGWPAHENRKAAVCGTGFGWPSWLLLAHVHLQGGKRRFRQLVPLARRPVSVLFWYFDDALGIRLPKLGSATQALRAQAPVARQLRRGRRAGKAWSGIHTAPCRKGIGAVEPQPWQRRQDKGNPVSRCVTLYGLPPGSGPHAMKRERHAGPPSRALRETGVAPAQARPR